MTRAEILAEIKQAEESAKSMVAKAEEDKNKRISDARGQAKEIIRKAEDEAAKDAQLLINEARKNINKEKETIKLKGVQEAEGIKKNAQKNVQKAAKFILTEFERAVNA